MSLQLENNRSVGGLNSHPCSAEQSSTLLQNIAKIFAKLLKCVSDDTSNDILSTDNAILFINEKESVTLELRKIQEFRNESKKVEEFIVKIFNFLKDNGLDWVNYGPNRAKNGNAETKKWDNAVLESIQKVCNIEYSCSDTQSYVSMSTIIGTAQKWRKYWLNSTRERRNGKKVNKNENSVAKQFEKNSTNQPNEPQLLIKFS